MDYKTILRLVKQARENRDTLTLKDIDLSAVKDHIQLLETTLRNARTDISTLQNQVELAKIAITSLQDKDKQIATKLAGHETRLAALESP